MLSGVSCGNLTTSKQANERKTEVLDQTKPAGFTGRKLRFTFGEDLENTVFSANFFQISYENME